MMRVLVILCLAGVALGGEVLKDSEGRVLVPVAKLACAPLFEVKDVRMHLFRVANSKDYAIAIKVIFIHHVSANIEVTVTVNMGESASAIFRKPELSQFASQVKPNAPTTVCFLGERALVDDSGFLTRVTFAPHITFQYTRSPAER